MSCCPARNSTPPYGTPCARCGGPVSWHENPLSRTRRVAEHGQGLHDALPHAIDTLRDERGGEKRHNVV